MSVWIQHDNADGTYGVNHDGCVKPSPIYFICGIHPARGWEVEPGDIHSYFRCVMAISSMRIFFLGHTDMIYS